MNELTIDGKLYISSKKAAEITGYAKDYVGQLCREGHVEARMVGRSWYVLETSIRAHRFGGDSHAESIESEEVPEPEEVRAPNAWGTATYVPDMTPSMAVPVISRTELTEEDTEETGGGEEAVASSTNDAAETLTDMQAAWKEWFAQKQDTLIETPEIIDAREEEHAREAEIEQNIEEFKQARLAETENSLEEGLENDEEIATDAHQDTGIVEDNEEVPVSIVSMEEPVQRNYEEIEEESEPVLIHRAPPVAHYALESEEVIEPIPSKRERKRAMLQARKARTQRVRSGNGPTVIRALLIALILLTVVIAAIGTGYADRYVQNNGVLAPVLHYLGGTSTISK